jgi:hypothetical protein
VHRYSLSMKQRTHSLRGTTATEYGLLAAFVAVALLAVLPGVGLQLMKSHFYVNWGLVGGWSLESTQSAFDNWHGGDDELHRTEFLAMLNDGCGNNCQWNQAKTQGTYASFDINDDQELDEVEFAVWAEHMADPAGGGWAPLIIP